MNTTTFVSLRMLLLAIFATMLLSSTCSGATTMLPLSVVNDQVVDRSGNIFQFRCANWVGHMEPNLPEGLQHQPLSHIVDTIASSGTINCVRLNYAAELFDKTKMTARESLKTSLGGSLAPLIATFEQHNPDLIDLPLPTVFQAVVEALATRGLMVLMSNHVSKAGWCCSHTDGNGWFNDIHFNVPKWLSSLSSMASLLSQYPNVVALDLRNELRTNTRDRASQISDWMKYIPQGISAINSANPNALIFVTGLDYDLDLAFLDEGRNTQEWNNVSTRLRNKIVFEGHMYTWSGFGAITEDCGELLTNFDKKLGWPKRNNRPLVITEFGLDTNTFPDYPSSLQWFSCVKRFIVGKKLGYAAWTLGGDYYSRDGNVNHEESYGLLNSQWSAFKKNSIFVRSFQAMDWTGNDDPRIGTTLETWTGIGGLTIADLRSGTNNLANTPNTSVRLTNLLEGPTNAGDNYGSRMKGWLIPPVTGDYVLWMASDDNGELWLSTNEERANMARVCHVPGWTNRREWTKYPEQRSMSIWLVAGQQYYYEALMKDWGSGDNVAIAWQYPGQTLEVIPARSSRVTGPTQSVNVFSYGDSLTWGHDEQTYNFSPPRPNPYAKYLEQELANRLQPVALVRHIGLSGWTSSQMLDKFNDEKDGLCPAIRRSPALSVVVLLVGTNDLWGIESEASPENRAAEIAQSIIDLHTRALTSCGNPALRTLSIGIPESRYQMETPVAGRMASLINTVLSEFASSSDSRTTYIDFPFPFQENDNKWHGDGIHMSGVGYEFLGKTLADPVMEILDSSRGDEKSEWDCYRQSDAVLVGSVDIWWGHTVGDAGWACNSWRSECRNSCTAILSRTIYSGGLLDTWTGIGGGLTIADLRSGTNNLANTPNMSVRLTNLLEGPTNAGDNYGSRMKGWLIPPVTGNYVLWMASDDNGELWLSTNEERANIARVCHVPGWTKRREWTKYPEQRSMSIWLVAGQQYYYEALMKNGGGGDNVAIAWQYPGQTLEVIPAGFSSRVRTTTTPPPTSIPTADPTQNPTSQQPTRKPTRKPTQKPISTSKPTSGKPIISLKPTATTGKPTTRTTRSPTRQPTKKPTVF